MKPDFYALAEKFLSSPRPMDVRALEQLLSVVYEEGTRLRPTVEMARIAGRLLSLAMSMQDVAKRRARIAENIVYDLKRMGARRESDPYFNGVDRTRDMPPNPAPGSGGLYGVKVRDGE